nr:hypothetical protein [Bacilli bacterium]
MENRIINGVSNYEYDEKSGKFANYSLRRLKTRLTALGLTLGLGLFSAVGIETYNNNHPSHEFTVDMYDTDFVTQDMDTGLASYVEQLENNTNKDINDSAIENALENLSYYANARNTYNGDGVGRVEIVKSISKIEEAFRGVMYRQLTISLHLSPDAEFEILSSHGNADGADYRIMVYDGDYTYEVTPTGDYLKIINGLDVLNNNWHGDGSNEVWASQIKDYIKRCDSIVEEINNIAYLNNFSFKYKSVESSKSL